MFYHYNMRVNHIVNDIYVEILKMFKILKDWNEYSFSTNIHNSKSLRQNVLYTIT